jgi:GNAT superfamily N-acetyltransferase
MGSEIEVSDWTVAEATEFMALEWPRYDVEFGIRWDPRDVVLVAKEREQPIGVARGVIVGELGELKQLLVKKERAHAGVGSRLLLEFEKRCRALHCHKLRLETAAYQARAFYEKHGFAIAATLTNDRFARDWFVMEKSLDKATGSR